MHAAQRASAQAHESVCVAEHLVQTHACFSSLPPARHPASRRWAALEAAGWRSGLLTRVCVRAYEDATQVRPAAGILNEQTDVTAVVEVDLSPVDRAQTEPLGADGELHRARDGVVVGQSKRAISKPERGRHQLVR